MLRRSILSVFAGVAFAVVLSLGIASKAGCLGFCPDRIGNYIFVDCALTLAWDSITGELLGIAAVECMYVDGGGAPAPEGPIITE